MAKGAGSGDKLARGAIRATYTTTEGGVTDKKWEEMFGDFDPDKFKKDGLPVVEGGEKELMKSR
jgi:hypothetical protein